MGGAVTEREAMVALVGVILKAVSLPVEVLIGWALWAIHRELRDEKIRREYEDTNEEEAPP